MPSLQSTVILATALLGSLFQHAAASPPSSPAGGVKRAGAEFPACIATCMRDSGCFDAKCVCRKAGDGILSDIVICMNQWCPADVTADDLIGPLEGQCDLPRAAVQDAEKKGGVADDEPTSTGKGGDDAVTMTFDLGKPVTNPAGPATTVTPAASGTLTVTNAAAAAATTGLLTDEGASASSGGSLGAATSLPASPSSTAAAGDSSDDKDNAAGLASRASIFGIVAAMGFALALGL